MISCRIRQLFSSSMRLRIHQRATVAHDFLLHAVAIVGTESIRELLIAHNKPGASSQISSFTEEGILDGWPVYQSRYQGTFDQFTTI
ncbi:hypothetical protein BC937DRAFT_88664 [Endogone sp. FLAS-F59071]|nr:hypothetical protein BC937DRAFT_88664 [Endogone sp. FLAS-F59071]|eukprot:RUS18523.1 hypothetical protein BC937DRAFT_88664 [Endogone sp. FLAS-F59071]